MLVALRTLIEHRRHPGDHPDRGRDVAEALGQEVLHELVARDRLAELDAIPGVSDRGIVCPDRVADGGPGDLSASEAEHRRCLAERPRVRQAVGLGHNNIRERDVGVLHDAQSLLVLYAGTDIAGSGCRHDEALHLTVVGIFRPDDRDVADRPVSDPPLGPVDNPGVAVTGRRGAEALRRVGARQRLGEAEGSQHLR